MDGEKFCMQCFKREFNDLLNLRVEIPQISNNNTFLTKVGGKWILTFSITLESITFPS